VNSFAKFVSHADDAECRAIIHCRQRAGVAMVQHRVAVGQQRRAVLAHALIDLDILVRQALGFAQQRLPNISPLVLEVLRESVATFHRGFVRSSALLLGTASEILMMQLIDAFIAGRPEKERQRLQAAVEDKSVYARYRLFREEFEKTRDALKIPDPVSKDIDAIIDLIFNAVRLNRNEAGHPSSSPLNPALVAATLQAFIEYAERIAGLSAFLLEPAQQKPEPPARRRRRRTR
jgi:hypothetical protein